MTGAAVQSGTLDYCFFRGAIDELGSVVAWIVAAKPGDGLVVILISRDDGNGRPIGEPLFRYSIPRQLVTETAHALLSAMLIAERQPESEAGSD
jgi:hypothetical protein